MRVLLVSCYELGHAPSGIAFPLARFRAAGIEPETLDLAIDPLGEPRADFIAVSVPMHTALRIGVRAARRLRELNPDATIIFHGMYAVLNADYLLNGIADRVCLDERGLIDGADVAPDRAPPHRYARLVDGEERLAGYVEATRGCRHLCTHCPIPPVYKGRFELIPAEAVLADAKRQIDAGATHITFGDPDFLNGPGHVMPIVRALPRGVTFDFTAKVEHILRRRTLFAELRDLGCLFVTSAVESLSERVLRILDKGHTAADVREALGVLRGAGIAMRPTFVPFTPWSDRADYHDILRFIDEEGLAGAVDPVQLAIRLLVPPGSLLLRHPEMRVGPLVEEKLLHPWTNPAMDDLHARVMRAVENGADFAAICAIAGYAPTRGAAPPAPRLTESWFC